MKREDTFFMVQGDRCEAWLYTPDGPPPFPGVVMAHGFGGTRRMRLDAYAGRFAAAGFAVLVFDYRHFGDSGGDPRQLLDIDSQLDDWREAIRRTREVQEIDPARIALWGSSFSGGHVIKLAAEDNTVAACISQAPFIDGRASMKVNGFRQSARLGFAALRDLCRQALGLEPYRVKVAGAPGALAALTSPDSEPGVRALIPQGYEPREDVAAGIFLKLPYYRPGLVTKFVKAPILFCLADLDAVTPVEPALKAAADARSAEVKRYPVGHFDVYVGETFEIAVRDQIDFLNRHLGR